MNIIEATKKLIFGGDALNELYPEEEDEDDPYQFAKKQFNELAKKNLSVPIQLFHL